MEKSGSVSRIDRTRRRFGRGGLAAGAAVVVVAATGVAFAGDAGPPQTQNVLATPTIDPESADESALRYLVGQGMSPEKARQRMANQYVALKAVTELWTRAPRSVGSVWLDEDGNLQVRVLDDVGAREARAVGATPVFSTLAAADVEAARDTLTDDVVKNTPAGLSGAVFEIDEAANKVIARYLFDEPGGVVPEAATELGDLVTASAEVASIGRTTHLHLAGATLRRDDGFVCTAAWAVDIPVAVGGVPKNGVMTAGHCFKQDSPPEQAKFSIETTSAGGTPATGTFFVLDERGDYGVLELGNGDRGRTTMSNMLNVVGAVQRPAPGAVVCKDGAKTSRTCGEILRVNVSVFGNSEKGKPPILHEGMTRVGYCAELGDSGAPVYARLNAWPTAVAAIGVHSGSVLYPNSQGVRGCGEKVGKPNEAYFTPVSNMDNAGKFFVRIDGG